MTYAVLVVQVQAFFHKSVKAFLSDFGILEDARALQDLFAGVVDKVGDELFRAFGGVGVAVVVDELQDHLRMLGHGIFRVRERLEVENVLAGQIFFHFGKLFFQSAGQNEQAHDLDYADAFLLDVVHAFFGVEDAVGVLFVRAVVAQDEIEDIFALVIAADRGDRVVLIVRAADHVRLFVRPILPCVEDAFCKIIYAFTVFTAHAHDRVIPIEYAYPDVGILRAGISLAEVARHHGQDLGSALIMIVSEDRAADNGQSGVRTNEVVREEVDEVEQPSESRVRHRHGTVFAGEGDNVFGVILIGRILQLPRLSAKLDGDSAQRLARGVVEIAGKAHVFGAEHAGRIARLG